MSKRILFVSHAGWGGSPLVLLSVVRWIRANTDARCRVLFWSGGQLVPEFQELAPCRVLHPAELTGVPPFRRVWDRLSLRPDDSHRQRGLPERAVRTTVRTIQAAIDERWMREWRDCDLVYANSVRSSRAVRALAPDAPLLAHVHEPDYTLHHVESPDDVALMVGGSHPIIAVSGAVKSTLVDEFDVSPSRVHLIYPGVCLTRPDDPHRNGSVRRSLGISDKAFIVGGAGTVDWRKGTDLFVQLAQRLRERRPDIDLHCVWVGGDPSWGGHNRVRLDFDVEKSGLSDRVHFVGEQANPWPYYDLSDVFVLTSRAEPLGLVAFEAATLGRPIVCFANAGGMPEFVTGGGGFVVPYLGLEEMASRVIQLHDNPHLRRSLGQEAAQRLRSGWDTETSIRRIADLIFETAR